jgi:hypothetical protein
VIVGSTNLLVPGRITIEELAHRAERDRTVIHVVEPVLAVRSPVYLFRWSGRFEKLRAAQESARYPARPRALLQLAEDLSLFLSHPTAPNGRVPNRARHGTVLEGGSYQLLLIDRGDQDSRCDHRFSWHSDADCAAARSAHLGAVVDRPLLQRLRGRVTSGADVLADLASGAKRPSEVDPADLPEFLQGLDLEPLLDPIFDFVDARTAMESVVSRYEKLAKGPTLDLQGVGAELAVRVLAPPRWQPSRR